MWIYIILSHLIILCISLWPILSPSEEFVNLAEASKIPLKRLGLGVIFLMSILSLIIIHSLGMSWEISDLEESQAYKNKQLENQILQLEKKLDAYKKIIDAKEIEHVDLNSIFISEKKQPTQIVNSKLFFRHCAKDLGLNIFSPITSSNKEKGIRIGAVKRKSYLWKMKLKNGDIISEINGQPMDSSTDILIALCGKKHSPLSKGYTFKIQRRKKNKTIKVTFSEN